jgi:hypothetical protein
MLNKQLQEGKPARAKDRADMDKEIGSYSAWRLLDV